MNKQQSALFSAMAYSYICFIDDYLAVLKNPAYQSISYMDAETADILKEMKTLFLSMPTLLSADQTFKESYAKKLVDFRTTLEQKYRHLHSFSRELQHITSFFNLKSTLVTTNYEDFGMTEEDAIAMDFSALAKDCTNFVFSSSDSAARQNRASSMLLYVPMRMTKDSFLSYIEKALFSIHIENTPENAEFLVSILRQQYDGRLFENYDGDFSDLKLSLEELRRIEDSEAFFEDADLTNETLNYTTNLIASLYHMICTFGNLLIFDALNFEALTDMHVSFYDLYCSIQNILSSHEDSDIFLETLPERVDTIKEQLKALYEKECKKASLDPLLSLMQVYLNMSIFHVFGFDSSKHDDYSHEVTSIFKDFLGELREKLETLSPIERKLRMQYFISVMPFKMNDVTFNSYVSRGFEGSKNPKQNLFTAMYLSNVLEQNGYFEALDSHKTENNYVLDDYSELDDEADAFLAHHSPSHTTLDPSDHNCGCGNDCSCDSDCGCGDDCQCKH